MAENLVWDAGVRVGSHHYAQCITQIWGARALWVSLPWTPFHLLSRSQVVRRRRQAWRFGFGTKPIPKLHVLSPLSLIQYRNLPVLRQTAVARLALHSTVPPLGRQIRKLGFARPDVLWVSDPRHVDLLDVVQPRIIVYRCPDLFASFSDIPSTVLELERRLVLRANLVTASSSKLLDHLSSLGAKPAYVPNGVELDDFLREPRGDRLAGIPRPRVLYAGALGEWFDTTILARLADVRPSWSIVLAGPLRSNQSDPNHAPIPTMPNRANTANPFNILRISRLNIGCHQNLLDS